MQVTRSSVFLQKCPSPASQPGGRRAAPSSLGSPRPQQLQDTNTVPLCRGLPRAACPLHGHGRSSPGSPGSLRWPGIQVSPSRHAEPSPSHATGPEGGAGSPAGRSGPRSVQKCPPLLAGSQALRCTWSRRGLLWASGLLASASSTATQAVFAISQAGGAHRRPDMGKKLPLRSQSTQRTSGKRLGQDSRVSSGGDSAGLGLRRRQEAVVLSCLAVWEGAPWRPGWPWVGGAWGSTTRCAKCPRKSSFPPPHPSLSRKLGIGSQWHLQDARGPQGEPGGSPLQEVPSRRGLGAVRPLLPPVAQPGTGQPGAGPVLGALQLGEAQLIEKLIDSCLRRHLGRKAEMGAALWGRGGGPGDPTSALGHRPGSG